MKVILYIFFTCKFFIQWNSSYIFFFKCKFCIQWKSSYIFFQCTFFIQRKSSYIFYPNFSILSFPLPQIPCFRRSGFLSPRPPRGSSTPAILVCSLTAWGFSRGTCYCYFLYSYYFSLLLFFSNSGSLSFWFLETENKNFVRQNHFF